MQDTPPLVRIASHDTRGNVLVTNQACHAGQEILREKPVFLAPPGNDALATYRKFLTQPPEVQVKMDIVPSAFPTGLGPMGWHYNFVWLYTGFTLDLTYAAAMHTYNPIKEGLSFIKSSHRMCSKPNSREHREFQ